MEGDSHSMETEFVSCKCCEMMEEYTAEYIETIRNLYAGKFICGLCSEAVKYEISRRGDKKLTVDEALDIQIKSRSEFVTSPKVDFVPTILEMFRKRNLADSRGIVAPAVVDGGPICDAVVIGGSGSWLPAFPGVVSI